MVLKGLFGCNDSLTGIVKKLASFFPIRFCYVSIRKTKNWSFKIYPGSTTFTQFTSFTTGNPVLLWKCEGLCFDTFADCTCHVKRSISNMNSEISWLTAQLHPRARRKNKDIPSTLHINQQVGVKLSRFLNRAKNFLVRGDPHSTLVRAFFSSVLLKTLKKNKTLPSFCGK